MERWPSSAGWPGVVAVIGQSRSRNYAAACGCGEEGEPGSLPSPGNHALIGPQIACRLPSRIMKMLRTRE
jgi:hypothetical protein